MIDYEIPKSLILTLEKTYLSPVSVVTLRQRCTEAFLYSNKMRARRKLLIMNQENNYKDINDDQLQNLASNPHALIDDYE